MTRMNEEQRQLRDLCRRFLAEQVPMARVREILESPTGHDVDLWKALAELGLLGLAVPEERGGAGYSLFETALVCEEAGRALLPSPYVTTAIGAVSLLRSLPSSRFTNHALEGIAAGEVVAAIIDPNRPRDGRLTVNDDGQIDGHARRVPYGDIATVLLVIGDEVVVAVEPGVSEVTIERDELLEACPPVHRVDFDGATGRVIARGADAVAAATRARAEVLIGVAADCTGSAQAVLDLAVGHMKVREQFGRPIGSFQALKHRAADCLVAIEAAAAGVRLAGTLGTSNGADLKAVALAAYSHAVTAAVEVAQDAIQMLGGIGFTWEYDAHLYLRRVLAAEAVAGPARDSRETLAALAGL